jgi:3-hydroxyisobutyrate dehydrogenase-like beta-hydroxyacid dehydrogenase
MAQKVFAIHLVLFSRMLNHSLRKCFDGKGLFTEWYLFAAIKMMSSTKIGFIGLGAMGHPIAQNILEAGFSLVVFNRTASKVMEWATSLSPELSQKVELAATPQEAAMKTGIVVSIVSNDAALQEITTGEQGILAGLPNDGIHLCMSTVAPSTTAELSALHEAKGVHYIACKKSTGHN